VFVSLHANVEYRYISLQHLKTATNIQYVLPVTYYNDILLIVSKAIKRYTYLKMATFQMA